MQNDGSGFLRTNTFPTTSFLISPPTLLSAFSWAALSDLFLPLHANQKHQSHPSNSIVARAGRRRRGAASVTTWREARELGCLGRRGSCARARRGGAVSFLSSPHDAATGEMAKARRTPFTAAEQFLGFPRGGSSLGPWRRRRTATTTCPISPRPTSGTRLPSIPAAPGSSRRRVGRRRRRRHPAEGGRRATACRAG